LVFVEDEVKVSPSYDKDFMRVSFFVIGQLLQARFDVIRPISSLKA
jgi:hypothetical protein